MFENINLSVILGPALIVIVVLVLILRARISRQSDEAQKAIATLKLMTVATGAFLVLLWFLLPTTPVLSTFGFPKTVEDIHSPERLLDYLQRYNRALVRTTEVLHWFIFVFVGWFLAAIYSFTKALGGLTNVQSRQSIPKPEA